MNKIHYFVSSHVIFAGAFSIIEIEIEENKNQNNNNSNNEKRTTDLCGDVWLRRIFEAVLNSKIT